MKTAFIFPAFISEYLGNEIQILNSLSAKFEDYLTEAGHISVIDFSEFSVNNKTFTEDELSSQLISYTFSCCMSDVFASKSIKPDYLAGYSMGLYAALFSGAAIDFGDGIRLIQKAYHLSKAAIKNINAGMGSIVGLSEEEIISLIEKDKLNAEIANTNNEHAYLVTGELNSLNKLLEYARNLGALNTTLLNVNTPYHSKMLSSTQDEFKQFIEETISFKTIRYPLISSISQSIISTPEQIRNEIAENLFQRIDWLSTFNKLLELNVKTFVECGAGKSLQKIARFISGDYQIYPMNKVERLIV